MNQDLTALVEGASDLGDFEAEYRALVDSCGLAARVDRSFVVVSGDRREEMLNGLVSNQVTGLSSSGRHAFLLTAKGRVLTDLRVLPRANDTLLDVPRSGLPNLLDAFKKYLPPIYATFEDVSDSLGQLGLYGPNGAATFREATGREAPADHLEMDSHQIEGTPALLVRNRRYGDDGVELIAAAEAISSLAEVLLKEVVAVGGRLVGSRALDVVRVESGLPEYGVDMSEENLTQETGLQADAISYDKGCYLGQEVVARVHFRGHVNRLLRGLEFDGEGPAPGSALTQADKEVGRVTSFVSSPDFGPIGLGYVRREIEPSSSLQWAQAGAVGGARVLELPFRRAAV